MRHRREPLRRLRFAGVPLLAALAGALVLAAGPGAAAAQTPAPDLPGPAGALTPADVTPAEVEPAVQQALDSAGTSDFWVVFDDSPDLSRAYTIADWAERGRYVYEALTRTAADSQAELKTDLAGRGVDVESYWIVNALLVRDADAAVLDTASTAAGVAEIRAEEPFAVPEPVVEQQPADETSAVEWGIADVRADEVWQEFGVRGDGIVVGSIDTGVDQTHPALAAKYRGYQGPGEMVHDYHWWDPTGVCAEGPCDDNNHGTHTVGTMVGDGGAGNRIGVAPHGQWIAAKGCVGRTCPGDTLMSSAQFMLAPTDLNGENAQPELRPHVVNNSWGGDSTDRWFDGIIDAWDAAGMFPVFANGNDGPACGSVANPANGQTAWGVGAHDNAGVIANFSGRGPGLNDLVRPDVTAPGVNVRSSIRSGPGSEAYGTLSGTSMAAPHQAGTIALLWAAAPELVGDTDAVRDILAGTADPVDDTSCGGTAEHNNVYGAGRLDAYAAVDDALGGAAARLAGEVTDTAGAPVAGVEVTLTGAGHVRTATTADDGGYQLAGLPAGAYDVTVSGFGYHPETGSVQVTAGQVTTHDATLEAKPRYELAGTVTDSHGDAPTAGGTVTLLGTPVPPAELDEHGRYEFDAVPEGSYAVRVSTDGCHELAHRSVTVDGPVVEDVALAARVDGYGYTCVLEPADYVESPEPPVSFRDASLCTHTPMPLPVTYYGQSYGDSDWDRMCVNKNGELTLDGTLGNIPVGTLPAGTTPRLYPFHAERDLAAEEPKLRTTLLGEPGDRRLVVEWVDYRVYIPGPEAAPPIDFQAVVHENGEIWFQYRDLDPDDPLHRGLLAVVGMESGGDAFSYAEFGDILTDEYAVRFLPPDGHLHGTVRDANQQDALAAATVTATDGEHTRTARTRGDGSYSLGLPAGEWQVSIARPAYRPDTQRVVVGQDGASAHDVSLSTGAPRVSPGEVELVVPAGREGSGGFEVANAGSAALAWEAVTGASGTSGGTQTEVRESWKVPTEDVQWAPMGLAFAGGTVWGAVFDPVNDVGVANREYALDGTPTGREWPVPTPEAVAPGVPMHPVAMTYDQRRGWMCQMFMPREVTIGGNMIVCWDPATGQVQESLRVAAWEQDEHGAVFTYDPHEDAFYVGRYNAPDQPDIVRLAGFSHETPGERLGSCRIDGPVAGQNSSGFAMGGLAFRQTDGTLHALRHAFEPSIHTLDPRTCRTLKVEQPPIPPPEDPWGLWAPMYLGLDFDANGDRLVGMVDIWPMHADGRPQGWGGFVHLIDGDLPPVPGRERVTGVAPDGGTLAAGDAERLTVGVDTGDLAPGVHAGEALLATDAGRHDDTRLRLPYRVHVVEPATCDRTVTGTHRGPLTVRNGVTCVADGASVVGPVRVLPGAGLVAGAADITGPVSTVRAGVVELIGTTIRGPVSLARGTDRVVLDGIRVHGPVSVIGNSTGDVPVAVAGSTITGVLYCTGNESANQSVVVDSGRPNEVTGPVRGQCARA